MVQVNEIFGPTFQGEGPSTGVRAAFVRLAGCNQHCWWCDTPHTWRFTDTHAHKGNVVFDRDSEVHPMDPIQVADKLVNMHTPLVVITGGEPLLQQRNVEAIIRHAYVMTMQPVRFEIETAGTLTATEITAHKFIPVRYNVSPKLENSRNPKELRYKPHALAWFNTFDDTAFKFVIETKQDLDEMHWILQDNRIPPSKVWVMPEGTDAETLHKRSQWLAAIALERGFNFSPRLHVELWGNTRGT